MNESQKYLLSLYIQTLDAASGMLLIGIDESDQLEYITPVSTRMLYMHEGEIKSVARYVVRDHSEIKTAFGFNDK